MGLDLNRWFNYAKARVNSAVSQGNASLDRREAEREADIADKPWLRSDSGAPTMDEARARIEWEGKTQRSTDADAPAVPIPRSPQAIAADAEQQSARLELDRREQASADRLEAIRAELGVDTAPSSPEGET